MNPRLDRFRLLHWALMSNAVFSVVSGLLFATAAAPLAEFIGLGSTVGFQSTAKYIFTTGMLLLAFSIWLFGLAARQRPARWEVLLAASMDVFWVLGSVVVLFTGALPLSLSGKWSVAVIAIVVEVFATLQFYGASQPPKGTRPIDDYFHQMTFEAIRFDSVPKQALLPDPNRPEIGDRKPKGT